MYLYIYHILVSIHILYQYIIHIPYIYTIIIPYIIQNYTSTLGSYGYPAFFEVRRAILTTVGSDGGPGNLGLRKEIAMYRRAEQRFLKHVAGRNASGFSRHSFVKTAGETWRGFCILSEVLDMLHVCWNTHGYIYIYIHSCFSTCGDSKLRPHSPWLIS